MFAVRGVIRGNTVLVDDAAVTGYDGSDVIVTVLDTPLYKAEKNTMSRRPGIAKGKFICPDDIDEDNEMIAQWFGSSL